MAYGQAGIAPPDVGHRNAAAVVRGGHAQRVALIEVRFQRLHPVAAILVRGAGKAPESAGRIREFVRRAAPAGYINRALAIVSIVNLKGPEAGQLLEESDFDALFDAVAGPAGDDVAPGGAVFGIFKILVGMADETESIDDSPVEQERFAGLVRSERLSTQEYPRAQRSIETERQSAIGHSLVDRASALCPRKRSQSETSGKEFERVSASRLRHEWRVLLDCAAF